MQDLENHILLNESIPLSKVLMYKEGNQEKPRILILPPTGVVALNINCTSIHTGLGINIGDKMYPLRDKLRTTLRSKLLQVWF